MNQNSLVCGLQQIQQVHGWPDREIADRLGISRVFWLKLRRGERMAGRKFLVGVVKAFPELEQDALRYLREL